MRKVYYLPNCGTCKRIISELKLEEANFEFRDIKEHPVTEPEIDHLSKLSGSYESLFSRIAMKYRSMGLHNRQLAEQDYRQLMLEEYTFLKRPTIVVDNRVFIGSNRKTIAEIREVLEA
jgi:arsenate reductase (glutaredoxin)